MSQPIHTTIQLSGVKLEVIDDIGELIASSRELQRDAEELTIAAHKEGALCAAEDHADCVRKGEFK